jgi:hypothetical protein
MQRTAVGLHRSSDVTSPPQGAGAGRPIKTTRESTEIVANALFEPTSIAPMNYRSMEFNYVSFTLTRQRLTFIFHGIS